MNALLNRLNIPVKIYIVIGFGIVVGAVIAVYTGIVMTRLGEGLNRIAVGDMQVIQALTKVVEGELRMELQLERTQHYAAYMHHNPKYKELYLKDKEKFASSFGKSRKYISDAMALLEQMKQYEDDETDQIVETALASLRDVKRWHSELESQKEELFYLLEVNALDAAEERSIALVEAQDRVSKELSSLLQKIEAYATESALEAVEQEKQAAMITNSLNIANVFIVLIFSYYVIRQITVPLREMTDAMQHLADGDIDIVIPAQDHHDELGEMAATMQVFKQNAIERERLKEEQIRRDELAKEEKRQAMHALADTFEMRVQGIISMLSSASTQLSQTAESMVLLINRSTEKIHSASSSATETSGNVQTIASAIEELTASVGEISSQVQKSNSLVGESANRAGTADQQAKDLADATRQVKEVMSIIADIAGQINLLALNATIESARAGEAGKGFAVVANEVKNLANQTNHSIEQIDKVIAQMNLASDNIIDSLTQIKDSVSHISEASNGIAAAVEEQSATSGEIARSMENASAGTRVVSDNLLEVNQTAVDVNEAARQVLIAVQEVSQQAVELDSQMREFLREVRSS